MKNFKVIYYIGAVFLAGVGALVYLTADESNHKTEPKLALSYYQSNVELVQAIKASVSKEALAQKYFWFGVEPTFMNQYELFRDLKTEIEKENGPFDLVIVDQELRLPIEVKNMFGNTIEAEVKRNWSGVAKEILKNADKKILIITVSVYATNLLKNNPYDKISVATELKPTVFTTGYFAMNLDEEKKNVFPCRTDDKEGVGGWGCQVINKSRGQRRKVDLKKITGENPYLMSLMDSTGEKDYMVLVR